MENMKQLVKKLNEAARNYYSELEVTKMPDREYDMLYDKLVAMEKESGVVLPDSPTLRVGYVVVSGLKKWNISIQLFPLIRQRIRQC